VKTPAAKSKCSAISPSADNPAASARSARCASPAESQIRHTQLGFSGPARYTHSRLPPPPAANHRKFSERGTVLPESPPHRCLLRAINPIGNRLSRSHADRTARSAGCTNCSKSRRHCGSPTRPGRCPTIISLRLIPIRSTIVIVIPTGPLSHRKFLPSVARPIQRRIGT